MAHAPNCKMLFGTFVLVTVRKHQPPFSLHVSFVFVIVIKVYLFCFVGYLKLKPKEIKKYIESNLITLASK